MKTVLNKEALLKKQELEIVEVDLGNDEFVYVRQMTGHERDKFEQSMRKEIRDKDGTIKGYDLVLADFRAKLAVSTICDDKGVLLLTMDDFMILSNNMSAKRLEDIINVAQKINNITKEDKEGLIKNLEAVPGDSSSSGSAES